MTVHVSDIRAHNKYIAPLRLPYQGREEDHKWKISVGWAQPAFLLLHTRTVHTSIVSRENRKQKLVKETENQYWLMAKILTFRGVKQEHGYEFEVSSTGGLGETNQQKVDLSKCCQPLTCKSSSPGDIHHAV